MIYIYPYALLSDEGILREGIEESLKSGRDTALSTGPEKGAYELVVLCHCVYM